MTRSLQIFGTLCVLCALALALPAGAEDEVADKQFWQEQHRELAERAAAARHAHETAVLTYAKKKQRRRLRGDPKREVLDELETTRKELKAAESALARFPEEARRAGALPGWFREPAAAPAALPNGPPRAQR